MAVAMKGYWTTSLPDWPGYGTFNVPWTTGFTSDGSTPVTPTAGDLLIIFMLNDYDADTGGPFDVPVGFTQIYGGGIQPTNILSLQGIQHEMWWKVADGSETTTTVAHSAGGSIYYNAPSALILTGADPVAPFANTLANGRHTDSTGLITSSTTTTFPITLTTPSFTAPADNGLAIFQWFYKDGAGIVSFPSTPAGVTMVSRIPGGAAAAAPRANNGAGALGVLAVSTGTVAAQSLQMTTAGDVNDGGGRNYRCGAYYILPAATYAATPQPIVRSGAVNRSSSW